MSAQRNRDGFAHTVKHYAKAHRLQPAEQCVIAEHREEIAAARVLDLGIGAGRTTTHLFPLAREYVGIDYVPELVAAAREAHPSARLEVGDARDLSRFADGEFGVVMFSFNGLDCVDHDDRAVVLREMRRVCRPGGLLIFSSHNRDYVRFNKMPWQTRRPGRRTLVRSLHALRYLQRHLRLARESVIRDEWAIINDDAHDWSMLLYYVTIAEMKRQLADVGFGDVQAYDVTGQPTVDAPDSVSIHYTARALG